MPHYSGIMLDSRKSQLFPKLCWYNLPKPTVGHARSRTAGVRTNDAHAHPNVTVRMLFSEHKSCMNTDPELFPSYNKMHGKTLVRFCTSDKFGVMTIDPTFTLGDFDVTIIAYRHLMLECRRSGTHPALIGPVLIHYRKSFSSYLFFASTLVGLRPSLSNVRCFSTDGETALCEAFKHTCPASIHLICCIHVRPNITSKLTDLGIKECYRRVIIEDIFGKKEGTRMHEGLIDAANSKEYENGLKILQKKWKNMMPGDSIQSFDEWFLHLTG